MQRKIKIKLTLHGLTKVCCFVFIFCFSTMLSAQQKILVDKGKISFTSNAPLEVIKASSDQMKVVIDPSTNQFGFSVAIMSFKGFNTGLQREHFNEKFMESDKYPAATFKGKIIEKVDFSKDGEYEVRAKGDLEVHGKKQTRIIKSKIIIKNGMVNILADFTVPLSDHDISIPRIIGEKIATEIDVSVSASMANPE